MALWQAGPQKLSDTNSARGFTRSASAPDFPEQQVAAKLGLTQRAYAHWERYSVALRPDQLQRLAAIFQVSVDELLGETGKKKRAGAGPTGKMRRPFEAALKLPRSQQEKSAAALEAFVNQHSDRET